MTIDGARMRVLVLLLVLPTLVRGQVSPFNGLPVAADSAGNLRILIGGHFYGSGQVRSGFPASTLLANLDTLNASGAGLFLSTGDLFLNADEDRSRYARAFFDRMRMPLFNAVGNHDMDGGKYEALYGFTYAAFTVAGTRVVILDTERDNGDLGGAQLKLLEATMMAADSGGIRQVLIVSHRPVWAEGDARYGPLFEGNTRSLTGTDFVKRVYPVLERIAAKAPVYWISGSMGGRAPASIFFHPHAPGITYIQCAIRDEPRDALLVADVAPDRITWSALSLTGRTVLAPQEYDAAWWARELGRPQGFNWRLLPYKVKSTVTHRAFLWGILTTLVLVYLVRRALRR